jgi:hypothetical protein
MTTDQDNKRVSDAYRDLARESTPAGLDDRILAMAEHESRSRYGLARAWVRPVAWAAMIGISLAFMLELSWFADAPLDNGAPPAAVSPERARQDAEVMKAKEEDGRYQGIAEQADEPSLMVPASLGTAETAPAVAADELAPAPANEEASLPRGAEKRARVEAAAARSEPPAAYADTLDQDPACDTEARASTDTWYACILELREQGLDDDAAVELEALLRAFPDFREPQPE